MKILLPVDGSEHTQRMLGYVAAHDEMFGPNHDYLALTAVTPLPRDVARHLDKGTLDDYYREQAQMVLRPVTAFAERHDWKLRASHVIGVPAKVIVDTAASEASDLIVMGSHGHGALSGLFVGSVTSNVLANCKTPVLVIR